MIRVEAPMVILRIYARKNDGDAIQQRCYCSVRESYVFAGELNIGASNNPVTKKKQAYKEPSIKLTQDLLKLNTFNFKSVDNRSSDLAEIAVVLWPVP